MKPVFLFLAIPASIIAVVYVYLVYGQSSAGSGQLISSTCSEIEQKINKSTDNDKCPSGPIVSVVDGGRLGNKVWEYAAVWSMAKLLGRPGYVPEATLQPLRKIFSDLSLPGWAEISNCSLELGRPVRREEVPLDKAKEKFNGRHVLLEKWILLPQPVLQFKNQLKDEFRLRPEIEKEVEETVRKVGGAGRTRVGIHVRRTDYGRYLAMVFRTALVNASYFKEAIQWFRDNVQGPLIFLVVTDDVNWCTKNLVEQDVVVVSKSPEHDLALLSTCDHTIIDYGTFGDWGALMAGGHTISLSVDKVFNKVMANSSKQWHVFDEEKYYVPPSKPKNVNTTVDLKNESKIMNKKPKRKTKRKRTKNKNTFTKQ